MCNIIHTDLKPENVLLALRQAELDEIHRKGCLKDPKHKPKHVLEGWTNFADYALGTSYRAKYKSDQVNDQMEEDKEEEFTLEKPKQLFYADIVPGYAEMNANKKKKIRRKKQNELREANEKALREWE